MNIILVINAGSSSLKYAIFSYDDLKLLFYGSIDRICEAPQFLVYAENKELIFKQEQISKGYDNAFKVFFRWLEGISNEYSLKVVSHRVVHGGKKFYQPQKMSATILNELEAFIPLAPLHQANNLEAIRVIFSYQPKLLQIACFDTAFHHTQNHLATLFAIPQSLTSEGIIRYGFHGLSYEYIASQLPQYLPMKANGKIIVAHLGNGASLCAMENRQSVATSMGFTALEGLMMGSRSGSIDPGVILYLLQQKHYSTEQVEDLLYKKSGLLGVSGISKDLRVLTSDQSAQAALAIDLFCYKAAKEMGGLITILKGCDAIVFTAGIGENSALVRKKICSWLDWLGVKLNENDNNQNAINISTDDSKITVLVIPTNEELILAKHAKALAG